MKKIYFMMILALTSVLAIGCDSREKLYVLNWGEYINEDLVASFEEEYNVRVVIEEATSNELMYNQIRNRQGQYDIAIPSDYMIHRMYEEDLLLELDFTKIPNYSREKIDPKLQELRDGYFEGNENYSVPYFWGTLGIMYNSAKSGVRDLVEKNGWAVFFNEDIVPDNVSVGIYDSSRDAIAAAELYKNIDLNTTDLTKLHEAEAALKGFDYDQWGTDELKDAVSSQNLDIALVYSGDFFDTLYATIEADVPVTFDLYVPNKNNIWFDAMVIPVTSKNPDLAHMFINYFQNEEVAYENAAYIGYCPTILNVYNQLLEDPDMEDFVTRQGYYPGSITEGQIYQYLGENIALEMDSILNRVKIH